MLKVNCICYYCCCCCLLLLQNVQLPGNKGYSSVCRFHVESSAGLLIQGVPVRKVNILIGHSIGHSKQKSVYVHVSYFELFPRYSYFTLQCTLYRRATRHVLTRVAKFIDVDGGIC
jgi:hypothetical protein